MCVTLTEMSMHEAFYLSCDTSKKKLKKTKKQSSVPACEAFPETIIILWS